METKMTEKEKDLFMAMFGALVKILSGDYIIGDREKEEGWKAIHDARAYIQKIGGLRRLEDVKKP